MSSWSRPFEAALPCSLDGGTSVDDALCAASCVCVAVGGRVAGRHEQRGGRRGWVVLRGYGTGPAGGQGRGAGARGQGQEEGAMQVRISFILTGFGGGQFNLFHMDSDHPFAPLAAYLVHSWNPSFVVLY